MTFFTSPIAIRQRLLLFARVPAILGLVLALAQAANLFASRDAALLGGPEGLVTAPWPVAMGIILVAAVLPGAAIVVHGLQRGILLGIAGLALYLLTTWMVFRQMNLSLPILASASAWYFSQVLGIGWLPHSDQDVRHILPATQRGVFISYRRSLDEVTARLLKYELERRGFDVFLDIDNLGPSPRFDHSLLDEIATRYNFILVLSPGSLDRCQDQDDWLRREVAQALATGRRLVPVTRAAFDLGQVQHLPPEMSALPLHNALSYTSTHHAAVMDQLVAFLSVPVTSAA